MGCQARPGRIVGYTEACQIFAFFRDSFRVGGELMAGSEEIDQSIRPLLKLSREHIVRAQKLDYALVSSLERDPLLMERLKRLERFPELVRSPL